MNEPQTGFRIPWWAMVLMGFAALVLFGLGTVYLMNIAERGRWEEYELTLREAGEPLTFEQVEARRADVPDDQNSVLVIERAMTQLRGDMSTHRFLHKSRSNFARAGLFETVPRFAIDDAQSFIEQHRPVLDALAPVMEMPTGRVTIGYANNPFLTALHYVSDAQTASRITRLDAALRLIEGDTQGAVDATLLQLNVAGSLNEHPCFVGGTVERDCVRRAIMSIEDILRVGETSDRSLLRLRDALARRRAARPLKLWLWSERAIFITAMERLADGDITLAELMEAASGTPATPQTNMVFEYVIRKNQLRGAELMTEAMSSGEDTRSLREASVWMDNEVSLLDDEYFLVRTLAPRLRHVVDSHLMGNAAMDCALVGVAAERFRMMNERWPGSLDELVPAYLDAVPEDPFADGHSLRLAKKERGIVIYSVGDDNVDDGGDVRNVENEHVAPDIGFRLLDPEHRGVVISDEPRPDEG